MFFNAFSQSLCPELAAASPPAEPRPRTAMAKTAPQKTSKGTVKAPKDPKVKAPKGAMKVEKKPKGTKVKAPEGAAPKRATGQKPKDATGQLQKPPPPAHGRLTNADLDLAPPPAAPAGHAPPPAAPAGMTPMTGPPPAFHGIKAKTWDMVSRRGNTEWRLRSFTVDLALGRCREEWTWSSVQQ